MRKNSFINYGYKIFIRIADKTNNKLKKLIFLEPLFELFVKKFYLE